MLLTRRLFCSQHDDQHFASSSPRSLHPTFCTILSLILLPLHHSLTLLEDAASKLKSSVTMTVHMEPLDHHDEAFDDPVDLVYPVDDVSINDFTPSLPSLINHLPESDAHSVSTVGSTDGDTISNHGSDADYDEITYNDIPALAARARDQRSEPSDEEMEAVMMSDRTIVPPTPTMAQRMPHISSEAASKPETMPEHVRVIGMSLADELYQLPKRPLRLVYLGDALNTNMVVLTIMAKVYGAMTGCSDGKEAILDAASKSHTDRSDDVFHTLADLRTPVQMIRAIQFSCNPETGPAVMTMEREKFDLKVLKPDLVVLHHADPDYSWLPFIKMVALHSIPVVEVQAEPHRSTVDNLSPVCVVTQTIQGDHCLRLSLVSSPEDDDDKSSNKEVPLSQGAFYALDDDVLSRHVAFLTDRAKELEVPKENMKDVEMRVQTSKQSEPPKLMSILASFLTKTAAKSLLALLMLFLATSLQLYFLRQESPASELATRTPVLQAALHDSGFAKVNATDILRYPVTTSIVGNSTTTAVAFPTAVHVHVAKSDQLLVSLPKAYWKSGQIGVFKNGKPLNNVNNTRVIDGVLAISLPPSDAHGQVQISVISTNLPLRNETIKVDLGNRLLQRATYENAAKGVQQDVTVVHNAAKLAQAKVVSDVHSVFNMSVSCVRAFGSNILEGVKSTGNAIGSVSNHTTHGVSYMGGLTYNKTSDLGAFVKSAIPQRRHWIRARNNALKIRTRLLRKSNAPKQIADKPHRGFSEVLSSMKAQFAELQKHIRSINALKRSSSSKQRSKASQAASKVKLNVETVVRPRMRKPASSATDTVKIIKARKQPKTTGKKLKS